MFGATAEDDEIGVQRYGADRAEIHNMSGFLYHNIYIGIAGVLYVTGPGAAEHEIPIDGPIDAQLVSSRDGFNWDYPGFDSDPDYSTRGKRHIRHRYGYGNCHRTDYHR